MAPKRPGKEIASSSEGGNKRQATPKNHGIQFTNSEQRNRYKSLLSKALHPSRYPDNYDMNRLGIKDNVNMLLGRLGWGDMMTPMRGYENFTYEFLSSIVFTKDRMNYDEPDHRVYFRLMNTDYEMSLENFCTTLGFLNVGYIHDSFNRDLKPETYNPITFWQSITGLEQYNSRSNKASNIHNPVLRYLQRAMACTIWGRKECGTTRTDEIFMLWSMLNHSPVNTCYYMLDYLDSLGRNCNARSEIVVGGIITFIARKFGIDERLGINRIEGNNKLNIETLVAMNFIKYQPSRATWELQLNIPLCFIELPNPSRTNTEVEANLLYVGDFPQEQDEELNFEEEGANLHPNEEHHDYNAGENFNEQNNRWAWMQTEINRISTEQQRQGVEITGLRNDVQRGNRVNDENNEMLRMMMQHFHLQGPPYGPQ